MYIIAVANTSAAKKAIRSSEKKRQHNLFWKRRIYTAKKNIKKLLKDGANADILKENLTILQKLVDKAVKKNVIHRNKANRTKATYAKKITAHVKPAKETKKTKATKKPAKAKSTK